MSVINYNMYVHISGNGSGEMSYVNLLDDLQRGEPSVIEFVEKEEDVGLRFEEVADDFTVMPEVVKQFIEAFRNYIDIKMTKVGGTPAEHVAHIFEYYDTDLTSGLSSDQLLRAATQSLKLTMNSKQASSIVRYYDRKYKNQIEFSTFLEDVCRQVRDILQFTELTARTITETRKQLNENPFTIKPFKAMSNNVLENFKRDCMNILDTKVSAKGGSKVEWLKVNNCSCYNCSCCNYYC